MRFPFQSNGIKKRKGSETEERGWRHSPRVTRRVLGVSKWRLICKEVWAHNEGGQGVKLLSSSVLNEKKKTYHPPKGGSFQFSCVVRTTRTIPQMISSTSKEFTFCSGNVPLLCPYTGFSQPQRRIVCLVSLFIIPSVHTTIVLNK